MGPALELELGSEPEPEPGPEPGPGPGPGPGPEQEQEQEPGPESGPEPEPEPEPEMGPALEQGRGGWAQPLLLGVSWCTCAKKGRAPADHTPRQPVSAQANTHARTQAGSSSKCWRKGRVAGWRGPQLQACGKRAHEVGMPPGAFIRGENNLALFAPPRVLHLRACAAEGLEMGTFCPARGSAECGAGRGQLQEGAYYR
jgi:hypothetical protein